jgi:oligoendopeptidase F
MKNSLPLWDLSDFYAHLNDPQIEKDLSEILKKTLNFEATHKGKLAKPLDANNLAGAIQEYEHIYETLGKVQSYAGLNYYTCLETPEVMAFFQKVQEVSTNCQVHLLFFELEINQISEDVLKEAISSNELLQKYKPWLDQVRSFLPHQLSPDLEKLMTEKSLTSRAAWVRLYDEHQASLKFKVDDEEHTLATVTDLMSGRDADLRQKAALALSEGLEKEKNLLTLITNVLMKEKNIDDSWRKFEKPSHSRHLSNQIEPEVVAALHATVKSNYSTLSHRYYGLKAKLLGKDKIEYWDRNAPLPSSADQNISWDKAKEIVMGAYGTFSEELAGVAQNFFDKPWIDVPPYKGKTSGAFAHPTVPSVHPYLMLNYQGKTRDVTTLAHELGHGVHQLLASKQGYFLSDTPLTLAETASVFGEMLTFRALLNRASNNTLRMEILASKIDDMINTVVRQIAFYDFELQIHEARAQGEISYTRLCEIWLSTQREALGPWVNVDDKVGNYWGYISHFIHTPFYVYAYAFGDCLVNSLYAVYQSRPQGFAEKYLELLKAGGSKKYTELLKPFDLNPGQSDFWQQGLNMITGLIDELESLMTHG